MFCWSKKRRHLPEFKHAAGEDVIDPRTHIGWYTTWFLILMLEIHVVAKRLVVLGKGVISSGTVDVLVARLGGILPVPEEVGADLVIPATLRLFKRARTTIEFIRAVFAIVLHVANSVSRHGAAIGALERVVRIRRTASHLQVEIIH